MSMTRAAPFIFSLVPNQSQAGLLQPTYVANIEVSATLPISQGTSLLAHHVSCLCGGGMRVDVVYLLC